MQMPTMSQPSESHTEKQPGQLIVPSPHHPGDDTTSIENGSSTPDPPPPIPTVRMLTILVSLVISVFLFALDLTILANAVPAITTEFQTLSHVPWYGSAFFLTTAPLQSAYGKIYQNFDHKWTFLLSIAIFEAGNIIAGFAPTSPLMIAGRAISGVGGGGIITGAFTIISTISPPGRVPMYMGILGSTFGVASVVGPLLGGVFTTEASWRWCFWINLPLGGVAAAAVLFLFKPPKSVRPPSGMPLREKLLQMDPAGVVLVLLGTALFTLAMQLGSESGDWRQPGVVGSLVGSAVVLALFAWVEHRLGARAMIQYRLLRDVLVLGNVVVDFFVATAYFPLMYVLPIYMQAVQGVSAATSGIWSIPFVLTISVLVIVSGMTMPRVPWPVWLTVGPAVMVTGAACLYTLALDTSSARLLGFQAVAGAGIGIVLQVPLVANQRLVAAADVPAAIGTTLFFETVGGVLFMPASQAAFVDGLVARVKASGPLADAGVTALRVLEAGATGMREHFPDHVGDVLECYMGGLRAAFLLELVCAVVSLVAACVVAGVFVAHRKSRARAREGA